MATPTLSNLGTESTYKVYICDGDGAKGSSNGILANLQNTTDIRRILLEHAAQNKALVYESTTYGYTNQKLDGTSCAYYYFLSDASGVEGTVPADALDITPYITNGYKTAIYPDANDLVLSATADEIVSGVYTYERRGNIQVLKIDTQSSAKEDKLFRIVEKNSQVADKDILIIIGTSIARPITIYDHQIGKTDEVSEVNKNIDLENFGKGPKGAMRGGTFVTTKTESRRDKKAIESGYSGEGGENSYDNSNLTLMYNSQLGLWVEISRSPNSAISSKTMRHLGHNTTIQGNVLVNLTATGGTTLIADSSGVLSDGGTRRIQSGVDSSIYDVTGTVTTANSYTVEKPFGEALEGDIYTVIFKSDWTRSDTTSGTNKVTVFGKDLTYAEAIAGSTNPIEIVTRYIDGAWTDGIKKVNSDHFEDDLGNPRSDGMVLTSTAAGVRSWGAIGGMRYKKYTYDFALHTGAADTYSLGTTTEELLPDKAIVDAESSYIQVETALTSSGSATVEVGILCASTSGGYQATDPNFFNGATAFGSTPFNAVGDVVKGLGNIGQLLTTAKVTFTINVAALTAGKVNIYVAYIEAA